MSAHSNTHLAGFETELDLHLAGLRAHPHVHLVGATVEFVIKKKKKSQKGVVFSLSRSAVTSLPLSSNMMSSSAKSS